jgi:hypothetical protein
MKIPTGLPPATVLLQKPWRNGLLVLKNNLIRTKNSFSNGL